MTAGDDAESGRVGRRLQDLAGMGADAAYTVSLGIEAYLDDSPQGRVLRNNGRHILIQVATVVEKLPDSFKDVHDDIEWVAIARMRNLIAHHYDKVDDRLVFSALAVRIPELIRRLGIEDAP
ncbi:HepT-like ribonuclease domain-containing protein [Jiangella anatolica]|nr:HepT-like ribonuclease domain-containing protein [Jiangella anatolica]